LPQRLEDVAIEFGQLVEEQHALIRARDLARRQVRPATDHPGVRDRVMRRTEGRTASELPDRALAGRRGDDRRRERRGVVERGQQPWDRACQQRLAGPGWADEQQAMAAGQGDLQPPSRLELAAHLAQVGHGWHAVDDRRILARVSGGNPDRLDQFDTWRRHCDPPSAPGTDDPDRLGQGFDTGDLDPVDQARLVDGGRRDHDPAQSTSCEDHDHRQDTRNGTDLATE
jgi:hypothetical protein